MNSGRLIDCKVGKSKSLTIKYIGKQNKDKIFKPRLGSIAGWCFLGTITYTDNYDKFISATIDTENLTYSNGFLGIGKYDQREYVNSQDYCGKKG